MNIWKRALTGLLAAALLLGSSACTTTPEVPPEEVIPEPPVVEENTIPGSDEPGLPEIEIMEQASLVDSDLMLHRLEDNLLEPISAVVRLSQKDNSMLTQLTPALLEEIAGFICQNYTVLREPARVDLRGAIQMEIFGEKKEHTVYIQQWIDGEGQEHSFVQVEEDGLMGQYIYDPTTYDALMEVLESWQYENRVVLNGSYQQLETRDYQDDLKSGRYQLNYLLQFGDDLLLGLDSNSSTHNYFELIDTVTGCSLQNIQINQPVLDIRRTDLEGYDFYFITADSISARSTTEPALRLDFSIPENLKETILRESNYPLFDLDYINDELVYISKDGVVLSNQAGRRNDLLLRHENLYSLLNLEQTAEDSAQEELTPMYVAPRLMNNGRLIVCPILLRGEADRWVGFSIFNLMNGTSKDYITEFNRINDFEYPNDTTITVYGEKQLFQMDVLTREVVSRDWSSQVNERPFFQGLDDILLWRRTMDYTHQLLLHPLEEGSKAANLLTLQGDRVKVYGRTKNYVLFSWSDVEGDFMAVTAIPAQS